MYEITRTHVPVCRCLKIILFSPISQFTGVSRSKNMFLTVGLPVCLCVVSPISPQAWLSNTKYVASTRSRTIDLFTAMILKTYPCMCSRSKRSSDVITDWCSMMMSRKFRRADERDGTPGLVDYWRSRRGGVGRKKRESARCTIINHSSTKSKIKSLYPESSEERRDPTKISGELLVRRTCLFGVPRPSLIPWYILNRCETI